MKRIAVLVLAGLLVIGSAGAAPKHKPIPTAKPPRAKPVSKPVSAPPKDGLTSPQRAAASDALKTLRKLAAASEVGVTQADYQSRLIDTKATVEEDLRSIPDGTIKTDITDSMQAYQDAGSFWNDSIQVIGRHMMKEGVSGPLLIKYSLELPDVGPESQAEIDRENAAKASAGNTEASVEDLQDDLNRQMAALEASLKIDDADRNRILSAIWQVGSKKEQAADTLIVK